MQINSLNSTSFGKKGYFEEMARDDIRKIETINKALKKYNASKNNENDDNAEEPKLKGVIATFASAAVGALAVFAIAKKGYRSVASIGKNIVQKESVQNLINGSKNLVNSYKTTSNISKALSSAKDKVTDGAIGKFVKKVGADNVFASVATVGATARIIKEDGNKDGVPDIMQKGVDTYRNIIKEADLAKEVYDTLA